MNRLVEVFTAKIGEKWMFAAMIDGRAIDAISSPDFDSREATAEAAKAEAERLIA